MTRAAIQLYSVRDLDIPLPDVLERVAAAEFDGVEFAHRYHEADKTAVAAALERTGLEVVGAHVGLEDLEADPDGVVEQYRPVDCWRFVLPHVPAEQFETVAAVESLAARLNDVADQLRDRNAQFVYHNQAHEFRSLSNGETAFDRLVAATSDAVAFEIDVGAAVAAGVDPVALLTDLGERTPLVHLKDVSAPDPEPGSSQQSALPGDGDVPLDAVGKTATTIDADWLVFEHDDPPSPTEALDRGGDVTRSLAR